MAQPPGETSKGDKTGRASGGGSSLTVLHELGHAEEEAHADEAEKNHRVLEDAENAD